MTTNQLIALLFPVAGAASAVAAGLLAKWIWVDRPRAKEARVATARDVRILSVETIDAISAADDLVEQAHRQLERARRGLQEQHWRSPIAGMRWIDKRHWTKLSQPIVSSSKRTLTF